METPSTEIICIIDRSGSMASIESDAIGGYNTFLGDQTRGGPDALFTLVLFNHEMEVVHRALPIALVEQLDTSTYRPCGTTALLDAVGRTVEDVAMRRELGAARRPPRVIVAILTDGLENASRCFPRREVARLIERWRESGWEFIFLAANQDAFAEARSLGMEASDAISFDATDAGVREAYAVLSDRVSGYRSR